MTHDHTHHRHPPIAPAPRLFSLAHQGLAVRLGIAAVLVAFVWVVLLLVRSPQPSAATEPDREAVAA